MEFPERNEHGFRGKFRVPSQWEVQPWRPQTLVCVGDSRFAPGEALVVAWHGSGFIQPIGRFAVDRALAVAHILAGALACRVVDGRAAR